jgi:hypothetical protein
MATHDEALGALHRREPIFHRVEFGTDRDAFEAATAPDFWEVGASGSLYTRDFVLDVCERRFADPAHDPMAGLAISDFAVREAGSGVWLATYELRQGDRRTRRVTVWRETTDGWQAAYHQGTVIEAEHG